MQEVEDDRMLGTTGNADFSIVVNVIVEKQQDGKYSAHCLELDLVAEAATAHEACNDLLNVIDVQVRTCLENDNLENLFFPAPPEVWQKLGRAKDRSEVERIQRKFNTPGERKRTVEVDQYCYV